MSSSPFPLLGPTDPSLLRDESLWDIFAASAIATPDAPAISFEGTHLSYTQLRSRAEQVAGTLAARGIGRGDFVGLWMSRSLDLHVALLGILRAGAAYIPFDTDAPPERVAECLEDCAAKAIIVDAATLGAINRPLPTATLALPALMEERVQAAPEASCGPQDPAYAIYTSGSTGKPKAIVISNRNICHYLRAANQVYGVVSSDVALQSASVAFDLSLEEIFVPYLAGASLWVAGRRTLAEAETLPQVLEEAGVTVIDTVPTLLSLMPRDVGSVRLILLGGEALPPALAERWCRPGRRIFNTYGPTEATVVATAQEVIPGQPVTIGRPIPNYSCWVVDDSLLPVAPGTQGELLIGGPGIAAGYLGRPELTAEKFIANPFPHDGGSPVLYRSGDAVSRDADGNLAFHGRIDDQVKIRGFRVELGEIEARLAGRPGIAQAAVSLRTDDGIERLVAFVVADTPVDAIGLRDSLRESLPAYMVPSHIQGVTALPRLVSGKLDRKALKSIALEAATGGEQESPRTATEAALLEAAQRVFPGQTIAFEADFFTDLGGHSLLAARFVSAVRETPTLASLTLNEIYAKRSLRAMAALLDQRGSQGGTGQTADLGFPPPPLSRRFLCGLAQALSLPLVLALTTAPWLGVFISYMLLSGEDAGFFREVGTLMTTYAVINLGTIALSIILKWLVIGRTRPGHYPLWGIYYFRWWLAQRLIGIAHIKWFQGTPIMGIYLRLLGARVGHDCILSELEAGAVDLLDIGDGVSTGGKLRLANAEVIGDQLVIGSISIGDDCMIGSSCVIGHDVAVGEGVELGDMTAIAAGSRLGDWEHWDGSPATRLGVVDRETLPAPAQASSARKLALTLFYGLMLVVMPPISLLPIFPAFKVFEKMTDVLNVTEVHDFLMTLPLLAWPTAMALILITVVLIAVVRWSILPVVTAGSYSVYGGFYLRKWVVALATELMLETLSSLYATIYMRWWYRLMGAKIGHDAEISCNLAGRYDLTEIGDKCFIADEVVLGDETIRRGWMHLEPVKTEARVFVGNDAVVPPGATIPTGTLIGIKSRPPANASMSAGDTWFGSPPIKLPVRQKFDSIGANWTYEPPLWRRVWRGIFEAFAVSLPTMLFITFGIFTVDLVLEPYIVRRDYGLVLPLFIAASVVIALALAACSILVKWGMMGIYRPTAKPMWSWWALRTEAVAVMYWGLAGKVLLDHLRGTPFLPWVLRVYGCSFGEGVFMDTTDITEFDCIHVGDFCAINSLSALQTHLYEDRVMKVGRVTLGTGVTIGSGSTVLYDTHVGDFARIGPLTIVMKGESIPAHGSWAGAPAQTVPVAP